MDQISLLEETTQKTEKLSTIHIVYENEIVEWDIEKIFDRDKYSRFLGVTYSISPSFMNRYLSAFDHVEITVGIPEDRVQSGANQAAKNIQHQIKKDLENESVKLYQNLSTYVKQEISESHIEIKVPLGCSIHSKFYLLGNHDGTETRIIIGSANLSEQAFHPGSSQFENIIIYDNSSLYNLYKRYYKEQLSSVLTNYFPKELLNINKKRVKAVQSEDEVILLNNEEADKIQLKAVMETLETVGEKVQKGVLSANVLEEMKNIEADRWEMKEKEQEDTKYDDTAFTIVKESINTRTKKPQIKKTQALNNVFKKHIQPLKVKMVENSLDREILLNKNETRNTSKGNSGLLVKSSADQDQYIFLGKLQDPETIRNSLIQINKFIETFEKYTFKYNDNYGQRIMETILYAFTSPFLFEIKKLARTSEERNDIPQFLFIGGNAGSGKSSLLKMISKMLGLYNKPYWNYTALGEGIRAKSQRVNTLRAWVSEENVSPILLDEIEIEFFSQHSYGRQLILETTNNKIHAVPPFPTIIGTTNADGYSLPAEARRRSYYLKIDKTFDPKFREESPLEYQEIYEKMDNSLFIDFIMRLAAKLESWEEYNWNHFGESGEKVDFLYQSREIFKEYYKMADMPLPRYFPTDRYSDDFESNQEKWKKLYKGTSGENFKFDESLGSLFFKTTIIDENAATTYGKRAESDVYKEALPPYVVHGSLSGIDIELDAVEFFKWLEIENPYKNHYKNKLIDYYTENAKSLEKTRDYIKFPIRKIAPNEDLLKRFQEQIPVEILFEINETDLVLYSEAFYEWTKIQETNSIIKKFFGR